MNLKLYTLAAAGSILIFSCVSPKQLKQAEAKYTELNGAYAELQGKYRALQDDLNKELHTASFMGILPEINR